jgi:hypothetical protein
MVAVVKIPIDVRIFCFQLFAVPISGEGVETAQGVMDGEGRGAAPRGVHGVEPSPWK